MREIGKQAMCLLLERILKGMSAPVQQQLLTPTLVIRQSCGAGRVASI
jgi:DNA-binding LacI/PurR family transcriptional regulator